MNENYIFKQIEMQIEIEKCWIKLETLDVYIGFIWQLWEKFFHLHSSKYAIVKLNWNSLHDQF